MADLIAYLEELKAKKLKTLEATLKNELEQQEARLKAEEERLRKQLESQRKSQEAQSRSQLTYATRREVDFTLAEERAGKMRELFDQAAADVFAEDKQLKAWLQTQVAGLTSETEGDVTVGQDAKLVKTLLPKSWKVSEDKQMKDPGFVFESSTRRVDARLSTYLDALYQTQQAELNRLLSA